MERDLVDVDELQKVIKLKHKITLSQMSMSFKTSREKLFEPIFVFGLAGTEMVIWMVPLVCAAPNRNFTS